MRRTKIVATIGPATSEPDALKALLHAGVDVVRLNAAHGTPDVHAERAADARAAAASLGMIVGVLIDLPGPKLRTGPVAGDEVELRIDTKFVLTADAVEGDEHRVSTTVPELAQWVRVGDEVFLADGAIVLCVEAIVDDDVECRVVRAGVLRSRKGMHVPRAEGHIDPFTDADAIALDMAVRTKADFVGLSFVRRPEDVEAVRARLPKRGPRPHLIAKIETAVALDHLAGIVSCADAVMVARGDLGIQVPARRVPLIQKEIIRFCNMAGKPVITATQMLESMTRSPLPTRAEVNDVANAVLDGTDALMLSEETAIGMYPTDTVRMMAEVAEAAEGWPSSRTEPAGAAAASDDDRVAWAVAHAAVQAAEDLGVAAIVCPTQSGTTARRVAAFRPTVPIVGISNEPDALGRLSLVWGVRPLTIDSDNTARTQLDDALDGARNAGIVHAGDLVAVVSASKGKRAGSTDTVRIVRA
jgi:pyruvate kinase